MSQRPLNKFSSKLIDHFYYVLGYSSLIIMVVYSNGSWNFYQYFRITVITALILFLVWRNHYVVKKNYIHRPEIIYQLWYNTSFVPTRMIEDQQCLQQNWFFSSATSLRLLRTSWSHEWNMNDKNIDRTPHRKIQLLMLNTSSTDNRASSVCLTLEWDFPEDMYHLYVV